MVQIDGPLAQRGEAHLCGVVDGYDWITSRFSAAIQDPAVGAVVLRIDSPGGDVAGMEEAVRRMRSLAEATGKKVVAFADELAASAAYAIAVGVADEVILPPMGRVGSIGTIAAWLDTSDALAKEGIKVHVTRDPEGKAALFPAAPNVEVADAEVAEVVTESTDRFVGLVASRRDLTEGRIRGLNGAVLRGQKAVDTGLADRVGSFEDAIQSALEATQERRMAITESNTLKALGLTPEASATDIDRVAQDATLGAMVRELTARDDHTEALSVIEAMKTSHESAEQERAALQKEKAKLEADERVKLLTGLIASGWETPATAWAQDSDGMPVVGTPAETWASMPIGALRARAETLTKQPKAISTPSMPAASEPGAEDLSPAELAHCKARNINPAHYAAAKTRIRLVQ